MEFNSNDLLVFNSDIDSITIVVNPKGKENATISIDAPKVTEGENVTITVTLPDDATGTITLLDVKMEQKHMIIMLVLIIIILAFGIGIMLLQQNTQEPTNVEVNQTQDTDVQESTSPPDTITVELPEFDKTYSETSGEYTVKAS